MIKPPEQIPTAPFPTIRHMNMTPLAKRKELEATRIRQSALKNIEPDISNIPLLQRISDELARLQQNAQLWAWDIQTHNIAEFSAIRVSKVAH